MEKIKEAHTNTGVSHQGDERSLSDGGTSLINNIKEIVFNQIFSISRNFLLEIRSGEDDFV